MRGLAKPKFKSFVQRAVAEASSLPTAQQGSLVELVELDCLEELGHQLHCKKGYKMSWEQTLYSWICLRYWVNTDPK